MGLSVLKLGQSWTNKDSWVMLVEGPQCKAQCQAGPWKTGQLLYGGRKEERRSTDAGKFVDFMVEVDGVSFLGLLTSLGSRRCGHPLNNS